MGVTSELLTLKAGALEVALEPQIDGSVSALRWRGTDLMRRLSKRIATPATCLAPPGASLESVHSNRYGWLMSRDPEQHCLGGSRSLGAW